MKRRNQQNTMNIYATFLVWLVQFLTNILAMFLLHVFYGQHIFAQAVVAVLHLTLNFDILPLFYVTLADEQLKAAIFAKDYKEVVRIVFSRSS